MKNIYLIPDRHNLEQSLQMKKEYGNAWEYNDFFMPEVLSDVKKQMEIINCYAAVHSDFSEDTMHGAFLDVTLHSDDPMVREASVLRVYQSMDIAREMGLKGVVFHTGRLPGYQSELYLNNWRQRNVFFLKNMLEQYPNQDIYLENMFDYEPDIVAELAEELSVYHNFGICLDYAHIGLFGTSVDDWLDKLAPYIKHLHINDNDDIRDSHLAVGSGKTDWQAYQKQMQKYQVDATVLIEVNGFDKQKNSLNYMKQNYIWPFSGEAGEAGEA